MIWTTLIDAGALAELISDRNLIIIDCRFQLDDVNAGEQAYDKEHIPGALYAHLDRDLASPAVQGKTGRHPLPSVEKLTRIFSDWGIDSGIQVVVYDDRGGAIASRLWWLLKWLGHEAVAVLDGGWQAWQDGGHPVSSQIVLPKIRHFRPATPKEWTVDAAFVDQMKENPAYCLIDSRSPERYTGEDEPIDPVAGHIPGAHNLPFAENLNGQGLFNSRNVLADRFLTVVGNLPASHILFYCGSGVTACQNIVAFAHAGLGMPMLYAGAWSDWITDDTRPIEKG